MEEETQFFGILVVLFATAKLLAALSKRIGQPAVLGELVAGVVLGGSLAGLLDPGSGLVHFLAEVGVVLLLFEIGLETDLRKLMRVGGASMAVAVVGVTLPFGLGYVVCRMLDLGNLVAIVAGAALTATSVGITARVLSDLNRLHEREGQVVLGAAIIDDVIGLVILAVVSGLMQGEGATPAGIAKTAGVAFGFLAGTLLIGTVIVPSLVRVAHRVDLPGTPTMFAVMLAFALAWLAGTVGSAPIIGAFAAGLLLRGTPKEHDVQRGVTHLGHFFVPIFFVSVGAAVDMTALNPIDPENRQTLTVGMSLIVAAVVGKFLAGYAPFWLRANKKIIGVGMIPRGEVGLIFAQMGLASGVFDRGLFSAVTLMVMATTFMAPPLLRLLYPPIASAAALCPPEGAEDLITEP
ncbi:MAG TPA: cation:proton antiporter [Pirellulales bacterium]|nr:cation:proton antiporter [Pirellulales bacterium]